MGPGIERSSSWILGLLSLSHNRNSLKFLSFFPFFFPHSKSFENDLLVGEYMEGNFVFNSLCSKTKPRLVFPWWLSGLRIRHCHCRGSGHCRGEGSVPGLVTYTCRGHSQKTKTKTQTNKKYLYHFNKHLLGK